ncbi:hypothetical protein LPJ78_000778 [Coemansia sp. RSA 989]|nr:hypothetical protein LPJ78_000778 [Coemansia sp. RSA 989]KAJ1875676.1 hypothetical protein LPJ55_000488 [Coemansia sp. RSA 990]KAJ2673886.1 hypothetical protein IWW42_002016 [Coemansia sp. RSA 1085]
MVKSVLVLGMAMAASASSFHGFHHNPRNSVKPFGPATRSQAHYTVHSPPVEIAPPSGFKQHLRGKREHGVDAEVAIAAAYLSEHHGIPEDGMKVTSAYRSEHTGVTHVYFKQVVNGLEVVNGNGNVNVDKNGRVISSGSSFASLKETDDAPEPENEHGWLESVEAAVAGTWEAAQDLASSAFGKLADELDRVKHMISGADLLHIQEQPGNEDVIDFVDTARAKQGRQHVLAARDGKSAYLSVKEALRRLAHHIRDDLHPHQLEKVEVSATTNVDGDPELLLRGLPRRFAADGEARAQAVLVRLDDGTLAEAWDLTVEQDDHWWNAQINARTGKVDALVDWTNHYVEPEAYRVFPWTVPDPSEGERKLVENPADPKASPQGWSRSNQTAGNNVYAQSNPDGGYSWEHNFRPTSAERVFDYELDLKKQPETYIEAAVTQLFYTNNFMHDLMFHYGFDEAAGNFQDENFSGKGRGNDAVIANAQDGSGYNNANFATPPDGRHPKMRMYVWDITKPYRDGDLEQGIVVHEYTHGISIRLTGGPANSNCLSYGEAGGMGEGWGDIFATIIRLNANHTRADDIPMGAYSAARGIRKYPYSTNMATNPSTYGIMDGPLYWEVHAKGEVWAEILYEVMWNLIDAHGFSENLFEHDLTKGNSLTLQLLVDGMKLQPCMPSFIDARDAILQADKQLTGGENQCLLWKAFAKRGLGPDAELLFDSPWGGGQRTEDFGIPDNC